MDVTSVVSRNCFITDLVLSEIARNELTLDSPNKTPTHVKKQRNVPKLQTCNN